MYKTYIKEWGLDKKNKEPEMRAIVRKIKQRENQGKGSIIHVRGRCRNFAEVLHYWERKGVSIDDIVARQKASPTPEAVVFSTPLPSPIMTPQVLAVPERILRCIQDYINESFESGTWVRTEPTMECHSRKQRYRKSDPAGQFYEHCLLACSLFSRNRFSEAGQTLLLAFTYIKHILSDEDPLSLFYTFGVICDVPQGKRHEVPLLMFRRISALGKVLLGTEHPLSRIHEWWESIHVSDYEDVINRCWNIMTDHFNQFLGPMHMSTLFARAFSISGSKTLQNLLGECQDVLQPDDVRMPWIFGNLADVFLAEGHYAEAMSLCQQSIACSQQNALLKANTYDGAKDVYIVAKCQYALGEKDLGIATLYQAINLNTSTYGEADVRSREWLLILEDWYLEQGLWESAGQVRDWGMRMLASMLELMKVPAYLSVQIGLEGGGYSYYM